MNTKYFTTIPNKITQKYLECLINRVYALLPKYEESIKDYEKTQSFSAYQMSLIQTINGNIDLIHYNSYITLDILSHLECLKNINNHTDYKRHILKICNLLTELKREVEKDGL